MLILVVGALSFLGEHLRADCELRKALLGLEKNPPVEVWFGVLPSGAAFGDPGLRRQASSSFLRAVSLLREKGAVVFCDIAIGAEDQSTAQRSGERLLWGGLEERARAASVELGGMVLTGREETTPGRSCRAHPHLQHPFSFHRGRVDASRRRRARQFCAGRSLWSWLTRWWWWTCYPLPPTPPGGPTRAGR